MDASTDQLVEHLTATDPARAEHLAGSTYLPHRIELAPGTDSIEMDLMHFRLGAVTVGRLSYGREVRVLTETATDYFVTLTLRGRSRARQSAAEVCTDPGEGVVYSPGAPCQVAWSGDCAQLVLKVDSASLHTELERMLGDSAKDPLKFAFGSDVCEPASQRWHSVLRMLVDELARPSGMVIHPHVGRYVEKLVQDGLLLAQAHNHSEALQRGRPKVSSRGLQDAVDLLEADPGHTWSVVELANEVHLSAGALQERFRRELDDTPMSYLKKVRLRRARRLLVRLTPEHTSVREVAFDCGFLHLEKFVSDYRAKFGEHPRDTLRADA